MGRLNVTPNYSSDLHAEDAPNHVGCDGPLTVEREDTPMDRDGWMTTSYLPRQDIGLLRL